MKSIFGFLFILYLFGGSRVSAATVIKAVYTGTATITSGNGSATAAIGASPTQSKSILILGVTSSSASTSPANSYVRGEFYDASNLIFSRNSSTTSTLNIRWYIAEFTSGVTVTRNNYLTLCNIPNTSSLNNNCGSSTSALSQLSFIPAGFTTSGTGLGPNSEAAAYVYDNLSGTRYAAFTKSGTSGSMDIHLQLVDWGTNATVYHGQIAFADAVDTTKTVAITGPPAQNKVWPIVTCTNSSGSTGVKDVNYSVYYNSPNLTVQRSGNVGNATCYYQVIVFNDNTRVTRTALSHSYAYLDTTKSTCSSGCDYTESLSYSATKTLGWLGCVWGMRCYTDDTTGQTFGASFKLDITTTANKMVSSRQNSQGSGDTSDFKVFAIDFGATASRRVLVSSK